MSSETATGLASDAGPRGVLDGITVLDLSRLIAGPYAAMVLADLGARVIKVEALAGEEGRHFGPPFYGEASVTFMACNRGKESLAIDIRSAAGRQVLAQLIGRSQVLVHNFRPDFAEANALTYDALREAHPALVYCAISAFGEQGPWRMKPAVDSVVQGMSGAFYASGEAGSPPVRIGLPIVDVASGMCAALGMLAAVMHAQRTGRGQCVAVSLADTMFNFMAAKVGEYAVEGREPERAVNLPIAVPSRHFRGSDGAWFSVSVVNEAAFRRFCGVIGQPAWLDDPRYARNAARVANRPALLAELEAIFAARPAAEWLAALEAADIPCGRVNTVSEAMAEPVLAARFVDHAELPGLPLIPFPASLGEGMRRPDAMPPPPKLGEHGARILAELGYGAAEIARLQADRVVSLRPN